MDHAFAADGGCYWIHLIPQQPGATRDRASQQKAQVQLDEGVRHILSLAQLGTRALLQEYRPREGMPQD